MEGAALETNAAPDVRVKPVSMAGLRRQAWAQSRDSILQESKPEPQCPPRSHSTGVAQGPSEEPGQNPNKIASWLIECRTPFGASLDDQSPPPNKGVLRNGCSFEDDLSLGAEANHLLANNNTTESRLGLVADQKRSQYKEGSRSMNSTGSGKSSTVSSVSVQLEQSDEQPVEILLTLRVSELLDLYEEDPEEILFNLGFGREEPDLNAKIPSRFFNNSSLARGIDIKVYLKAQLQRMELENPNYALTSRFRQIEVLTTVANEFFQLYSQVSGQPVQRISSKDQDSEGDEGRTEEKPPPLKKSSSALNVAKLLKRTITKHNLLAASPESPALPNGRTAAVSNPAQENGHAPAVSEPEGEAAGSDPKAEAGGQKPVRKKDNCSLATVTEESGGDGEPDPPSDNSPEQSSGAEHQVDSAELQTQSPEQGGAQEVSEERDQSASTTEKAPPTLTPPLLAHLRIENTDSFDMEEIQSNEDETPPTRTSRAADLSRTVSQQSDSSGFAEEPSTDSSSSLKVQESSDSCDSETTVTSHPSQDLATPVALDQPTFDLPDTRQEEAGPDNDTAEVDGRRNSVEEDESKLSSEQFPQYTVHQLPKLIPEGEQQDESLDEDGETEPEPEVNQSVSAAEEETLQESEDPQSRSVSEQDPQHTENPSEIVVDTSPPTEGDREENGDQQESLFSDEHNQVIPPTASSQVLSALNRAKRNKLSRMGQRIEPESHDMPPSPGRGRSSIRLQRSSSLPSSLRSPSRVVSSVRIQVGRGQASCSRPRFSVKYTQEDGQEQEVEQEEPANVLSTLIINPAPSSASNKKLPTAIPPTPIPSHLMRSFCSLQSTSPPPEWTPGGQSWSTQSVPDLSSDQRPLNQPPLLNMSTNQNQKSWNPDFTTFPGHHPPGQYFDPSPSPSPSFNFSPYVFPQHTHPLHHSQPYSSLPNLFHHQNPSMNLHSGLTGHHTPATPPVVQHQSLSNLHQPSNSTLPYHVGPGHRHSGNPMMHPQGYNHPYTNPSPYNSTPHGAQSAPQYLSYQGYVNSFSHPVSQYPPPPPPPPPHMTPEHSLYPGLAPPAPGFHPGHGSAFSQGYNFHSGFVNPPAPASGPGQGLSGTEIQLRRVLHEIRGTVQSLIENRVNTPDTFSEHRAAQHSLQSLSEFQQKRRSLNLFRRQMMDLELSIMQQQALVYNHLSPADRMEVEKLQSLRSSVREELQELEQQLEEKLMDLIHSTQRRGLRSNSSVDNLSTASALRAMEQMSDLLSEQFHLQSELNYDGHESSTYPSSRSSSPFRGRGAGGDSEQKQELYRTSVDITPATPPRPNTRTKGKLQEMEEEVKKEVEKERDRVGDEVEAAGKGDAPEKEVEEEEGGATGGLRLDNLQQLIKEIRESVAQEVRKEIYSELLAAVTTQKSPVPAQQHRP